MRTKPWMLVPLLALPLLWAGCADDDDECDPVDPGGIGALAYVGSATCAQCHAEQAAATIRSGHSHKITKVVDGQKPDSPYLDLPNDLSPAGIAWTDVAYVIGGYEWKSRFVLKTAEKPGYIHTGAVAQYNNKAPAGSKWVAYEASNPMKPYDCGKCHVTGWQTFAENGGVNQDGLEGIRGTWTETGIRCERCHGPGSRHVETGGDKDLININRTSDLCGECHFRDTNHRVLASHPPGQPIEGFIRHHETYDEMLSGRHASLLCTSCHDPHKGVRKDDPDGSGIRTQCQSCHAAQAATLRHPPLATCVDCHMAYATRSGISENRYKGDVRTHIFKVRDTPDSKESMFVSDGTVTFVPHGYGVTLDFACYGCHKDANGVGGQYSQRTLEALAERAAVMHTPTGKTFAGN